jgi:hypothetical protein
VWTVEAREHGLDPRYHGGADSTDRRSPIQPASGSPPGLRLNLDAPLLPAGRQLLAFLPDRLLVFEGSKVGAVAYPDLRVARREVRFVEPETPPSDATVVERTWRHVNKSGEPDRRFRENPEMAVCAYDEIELSSDSGLREVFQFSRRGAARGFAEALRDLGRVGDPAG